MMSWVETEVGRAVRRAMYYVQVNYLEYLCWYVFENCSDGALKLYICIR